MPAEAAQLQSWWFDAQANRLTFITDTGVQPRAQLIINPTRIVIDLPNTTLSAGSNRQVVGGALYEVRSGQFDQQTARIVIELSRGYIVDPQQVQVQGVSPTHWIVQMPTPEQGTVESIPAETNQVQGQTGGAAAAQLEGIVATGDGFLIKLGGAAVEPIVEAEQAGTLRIELPNTTLAPTLGADNLPNNRYGVLAWDVLQQSSNPPSTLVTLTLAAESPEWRVLSNQGGVILLPPRGMAISSISDRPPMPVNVQSPEAGSSSAGLPSAGLPSSGSPNPGVQSPVAGVQSPPASVDSPVAIRSLPPTHSQQPILPPRPQPGELPFALNTDRIVVVIDPGHGGRDPGAVGRGGLQEKQVIFPISQRVTQLLEAEGVTVVMTRYDDRTLDLQPRVDIAERANANLFVSIHANAISLSRPDVNGLESYYSSADGRQLAATIHASMLAATGMNDRGVRRARFFVIRRTSMPATLLEVGFVTGEQDAPRLADPAWRETMANAIARGILQYIRHAF